MSDFMAKKHQIRSLRCSPRPPSWIQAGLPLRPGREGTGKEKKGWQKSTPPVEISQIQPRLIVYQKMGASPAAVKNVASKQEVG